MKKPTSTKSGRAPWKHKEEFSAFHASHGRQFFTPVFNRTIEAQIQDKSLSKEHRVLLAIQRYAWGNLSDWAVDAMPKKKAIDPMPRPLTQERLGEMLGLKPATMSEACRFLRENGYLRKDHQFLYPEEEIDIDSKGDNLESGSNSTNFNSPYIRFQEDFFRRNPELGTTLSKLDHKRKRFQDASRAATVRINKIKRLCLSEWRDVERNGDPMRYCATAQNEREEQANCTYPYTTETDSNSNSEKFATPSSEFDPSRIELVSSPKKTKQVDSAALNPSGIKAQMSGESVSQSLPEQPDREGDRPTDPHAPILAAIPVTLLSRLADTPSPQLLNRIAVALGDAPTHYLTTRIEARAGSITALGILVKLAEDVNRAWRRTAHTHNFQNEESLDSKLTTGIPPQSETEAMISEVAAGLRRKYATKR